MAGGVIDVGLRASSVLERARRFKALRDEASSNRLRLAQKLQGHTEEFEEASHRLENLQTVFAMAKALTEKISRTHMDEIEGLVTSVLKSVFFDRDYRFSISVSEKRDAKSADFFIEEDVDGETFRTPLKTSRLSGGVISVVGFVLQVYFIRFFKLTPLVFIDEGFATISDEYLERWFDFLHRIRDEMGFMVVLITHDERFMGEADRVYHVEDGKFTLTT